MRWDYGNKWKDYPIEYGQIAVSGNSSILCADVVKEEKKVRSYLSKINPSMIYVDPPWDKGNMNSFMTKAGLPHLSVSYIEWFAKFVHSLEKYVNIPVFIEMGKKNLNDVVSVLEEVGFSIADVLSVVYLNNNPSFLIACYKGICSIDVNELSGASDWDTPVIAIRNNTKVNDIVLDLCAGRGLTAKSAFSLGRFFCGVEINKMRAAWVVEKLSFGDKKRVEYMGVEKWLTK